MATRCCSFEVQARHGNARAGVLHLPHGDVPTPAFMPVGTRATVRGLTPSEIRATGATMVLANTYHLWVRPGHAGIAELGGLHRFMGWSGPILTDSGGYQVFSLDDHVKVSEEGVKFRSPEDGAYRFLTPELAVEIQETLGVDVAMALDECIEFPADRDRTARSTERTTRWLRRCLDARRSPERTALFGIVQGGTHDDLRAAHAEEIASLDLDGYGIGGLSVGEGRDTMVAMAAVAAARLPDDRPRYLMGVGYPHDLVDAVIAGVDLFDCVVPTRAGRHGTAFTSQGKLNLAAARHASDPEPLEPGCGCTACSFASRAYLRHLVKAGELLGKRLISEHNLWHWQAVLREVRAAVVADDAPRLAAVRKRAATSAALPA